MAEQTDGEVIANAITSSGRQQTTFQMITIVLFGTALLVSVTATIGQTALMWMEWQHAQTESARAQQRHEAQMGMFRAVVNNNSINVHQGKTIDDLVSEAMAKQKAEREMNTDGM